MRPHRNDGQAQGTEGKGVSPEAGMDGSADFEGGRLGGEEVEAPPAAHQEAPISPETKYGRFAGG